MFAMNLDKLNVNEAELKAFIYQQLNDIQPYVGETPVAIKLTYTTDKRFYVKILASYDIGDVEATGSHEDVYSALAQAKDALIKTVSVIDEDDDSSETLSQRDLEINSILHGKPQVH